MTLPAAPAPLVTAAYVTIAEAAAVLEVAGADSGATPLDEALRRAVEFGDLEAQTREVFDPSFGVHVHTRYVRCNDAFAYAEARGWLDPIAALRAGALPTLLRVALEAYAEFSAELAAGKPWPTRAAAMAHLREHYGVATDRQADAIDKIIRPDAAKAGGKP